MKLKVIVWMDELGFYLSFNSISVVSEGWKDEHERLCAMKRLFRLLRDWNPSPRDPKFGVLSARSLLLY